MLSVSQLRNIGIVDNNGCVVDYPELSDRQRVTIIKEVLAIFNGKSGGCMPPQDTVAKLKTNIEQYLGETNSSGRSLCIIFPDFIIRAIIQKYGPKMIDHMLLQDD
jgi:hypothetical protein